MPPSIKHLLEKVEHLLDKGEQMLHFVEHLLTSSSICSALSRIPWCAAMLPQFSTLARFI